MHNVNTACHETLLTCDCDQPQVRRGFPDMPSTVGPSSPAAAMQEALESAGRLIDRHLQEDRCFPDLSELLNVPAHSKSRLLH